ncbi:hypothetical protein [Paenibacillus kandeliae]|uniref:hypothetical protein n=1 Tax=Paenibacillus kandeliae TaxID=3231269 RepID=UPI003458917D
MKSSRYYTLLLTGALLIGTMTQTANAASAISPGNVANKGGGGGITTQDTSDTRFDYFTVTKKDGAFVAAKYNSSGDSYVGLNVKQDGQMVVSIEKYNFSTKKWDPLQVKLLNGSARVYYRVPTDRIYIPPTPYRVVLSTTGTADVEMETTYTWESDSNPNE